MKELFPVEQWTIQNAESGLDYPLPLFHRPNTIDGNVLQSCIIEDAYRLREQGINSNSIVVDIGAYIGAVSALAGYLGAKIYAVEPVSENCSLYKINTAPFSKQCKLYEIAISENPSVDLVISDPSIYHFMAADPKVIIDRKDYQLISYPAQSLNSFLDSIIEPKIDFLKLDAEGAELTALPNLSLKNKQRIKSMIIELHPVWDSSRSKEEQFNTLLEATKSCLTEFTLTEVEGENTFWENNEQSK